MVLDYLTAPADPTGIGPLQSASMLAIVDMHDREVDRTVFVSGTSDALALHTAMGRLDTLVSVRAQVTGAEPISTTDLVVKIDAAINGLCTHASTKRNNLRSVIKLVAQMPTADDSIN